MDEIPLHLRYKGDRNYLQGGDFYNRINSMAPTITGLDGAYLSQIVFRAFCRNDADICFYPPSSNNIVVGSGDCVSGENFKKKFWIIESDRLVKERYPFDEARIVEPAAWTSTTITLSLKTGYTPIEEAIALTKALSYKTYPSVLGKWVFGQLDLKQPFQSEYGTIHIEQKTSFAGKFILNAIYQDNTFVGDIRFIVGKP